MFPWRITEAASRLFRLIVDLYTAIFLSKGLRTKKGLVLIVKVFEITHSCAHTLATLSCVRQFLKLASELNSYHQLKKKKEKSLPGKIIDHVLALSNEALSYQIGFAVLKVKGVCSKRTVQFVLYFLQSQCLLNQSG